MPNPHSRSLKTDVTPFKRAVKALFFSSKFSSKFSSGFSSWFPSRFLFSPSDLFLSMTKAVLILSFSLLLFYQPVSEISCWLTMTSRQSTHRAAGNNFLSRLSGSEPVTRANKLAQVVLIGDNNFIQSRFKVIQVSRQTENRHNFRSHGNVVAVLPWETISGATQTTVDAAQGAVIHIRNPFP